MRIGNADERMMSDFRGEERIFGERCEWPTMEKRKTRDGCARAVLKRRSCRRICGWEEMGGEGHLWFQEKEKEKNKKRTNLEK